MSTTITLTPAQEAWLEAQVAAGRLPSIDDGVRSAVADLMTIANDDLAWAKPYGSWPAPRLSATARLDSPPISLPHDASVYASMVEWTYDPS